MREIQNPKSRPKPPQIPAAFERAVASALKKRKPSCATCSHFNATNDDGGECRRYPPQAITAIDGKIADRFPGVRKADIWCGEWRKSA